MAAFVTGPARIASLQTDRALSCPTRSRTHRSRCHGRRAPVKAALLFYAHDGHSGENDLLVQDTDVLGGIADGVKSFLNLELRNHLANYEVKFGSKIKDISIIDEISVRSIRKTGMDVDIITCEDFGCVCVSDYVPWMDGEHLETPEQIPDALKRLSSACGLPVDQL